MILEKDGAKFTVQDPIQISAFLNCGWKETEKEKRAPKAKK